MTNEKDLPVGRELDAAIAWALGFSPGLDRPAFSTESAAAVLLLAEAERRGWPVFITHYPGSGWPAMINGELGESATFAEAVSRAFLAAATAATRPCST